MAIRITCPSCDTANSVGEDKRGKRIKCKSCDELISVPKKRGNDDGIQEVRNVRAKASGGGRKSADDDDDDAPLKKSVKQPKKSGTPIILGIVGAVVAVLLLCVVGVVGGVYFVFAKTREAVDDLTKPLAQFDQKKDIFADFNPKVDFNPMVDFNPKIEPKPNPNPPIDANAKTDTKATTDKKKKTDGKPRPTDGTPKVDGTAKTDGIVPGLKPKSDGTKVDPLPKGDGIDPLPKADGNVDPRPKINPKPKIEPGPKVEIPKARTITLPPLDPGLLRNQANLTVNQTLPKDRTVKVATVFTEFNVGTGPRQKPATERMEADVLESLSPHFLGASVRTAYGNLGWMGNTWNATEAVIPRTSLTIDAVRKLPPVFVIDRNNSVKQRNDRNMDGVPGAIERNVREGYWQMHTALEATSVPLPNRPVNPQENWQVTMPLSLRKMVSPESVDLLVTCTYEGIRGTEAIITVMGKVQNRSGSPNAIKGDVGGRIGFDLQGGFISSAKLQISYEYILVNKIEQMFEVDLRRVAGNPNNILAFNDPSDPLPKFDPKADPKKDPKAEPKVLNLALSTADPLDPTQKQPTFNPKAKTLPNFHRMKLVPVQMQAGKKYTITLATQAFSSGLRIHNAIGQVIAQAPNAAGNSSTLVFTAPQTGVYPVVCASRDGKLGPFQLTVLEQ